MQTYSHSGTVPVAGGIYTPLIGLATAGVGGFVYAYAFQWMPIGLLRLLLLGIYCLVVGVTIAITANSAKIRSPLFVTIVAIVCTLFGLWIYWGAYRWAKEGVGAGLAAWSPAELAEFGQRLFEEGSFKIRRSVIDGWLLVGFWIAEVGVMLWAIVSLARSDVHTPFCESCNEWTAADKTALRFAASGKEPSWSQILAGDFVELGRFETASQLTPEHVRLNVASCPKCVHSNFLTINAVTVSFDKKGKSNAKERTIIRNAHLTDTQTEMLRALANMLGLKEDVEDEDFGDEEPDSAAAEQGG
jgi:hypothetical protein